MLGSQFQTLIGNPPGEDCIIVFLSSPALLGLLPALMPRVLWGSLTTGAWAGAGPPQRDAVLEFVGVVWFFPFLDELCRGHVWSSESPLAPHIPHVGGSARTAAPAPAGGRSQQAQRCEETLPVKT